MNKYRVLKPYPKQITNSGRLVTLQKGKSVYLKREAQVLRLVRMGFLKPIVEMPAKPKKKSKPAPKAEVAPKQERAEEAEVKEEPKQEYSSKKKSKSDYLNKKK